MTMTITATARAENATMTKTASGCIDSHLLVHRVRELRHPRVWLFSRLGQREGARELGCPLPRPSFVAGVTLLPEGGETMKYALLIYTRGTVEEYERLSEEERQSITDEYLALAQEPGVLGAEQLQPAESATTVRVADGKTLTTDGPFADTKEILGGLYLVEANDLDRALELAERIPAARLGGAVEVRPLVER
jgi:hypothetical protein